MSQAYLLFDESHGRRNLFLVDEKHCNSYNTQFPKSIYRYSPIFRLHEDDSTTPENEELKCKVAFLFPSNSYTFLGKLRTEIDLEFLSDIWFGHGLASVIIIDKSGKSIDTVLDRFKSELRAYEIWNLSSPTTDSSVCSFTEDTYLCEPFEIDHAKYRLSYDGIIDLEVRKKLDDLSHNFLRLTNLSAQYAPAYLFTLRSIILACMDIIEELEELYKIDSNNFEASINGFSSDVVNIPTSPRELQEMIFQRTGYISQILAVVTYIDSQVFSGTVPILENNCKFSGYSFLGIGTAHLGIVAITQFVEKIFSQYPITKVIDSEFHGKEGFQSPSDIYSYVSQEIYGHAFILDANIDSYTKDPIKSSLVYYSTRLGFRESEFSITSADEVLRFSDSVEWSPITLSHELLHAHVRDLIGALFASEDNSLSPFLFFSQLAGKYIEEWSDEAEDSPMDLYHSVQAVFLSYCYYRESYYNILARKEELEDFPDDPDEQDEEVELDLSEPNTEALLERLRAYYKEINEILVHVLDYHYFYYSERKLYVSLLWRSWAKVPSVLDNIDHYLLRTLLCIGTEVEELADDEDRFRKAVDALIPILQEVQKDFPSTTLSNALEHLSSKGTLDNLQHLFDTAIRLADIAYKFLRSDHINSKLLRDQAKTPEVEYHYDIATGQFSTDPIESPVAFLIDRIRFNSNGAAKLDDIEFRTLWMMIALASSVDHINNDPEVIT